MTWPDITGLITHFKAYTNNSFQCVVTKVNLPNFHIFTLIIPCLKDNLLYKNQAAKFSTILDGFLLIVDCIKRAPTWVDGEG